MNIRLLNITRKREDIPKLRKLYFDAFPENERAPFNKLIRRARARNVNFFSCYDGDMWIGFIYIVNHGELSYIFYFAVDMTQRGKGYGTAILKAAQKKYAGRKLFLAAEEPDKSAPNYPERVRRINFYLNAGFERLGVKIQEAGVIFDALGIGGSVTNKEYRALMRSFSPMLLLMYTIRIIED